MSKGFQHFIHRILNSTGRQLQLCCSREVGNIPSSAFAKADVRLGRLR